MGALHGHGRCARGRGRRVWTLPRRTEHEAFLPSWHVGVHWGMEALDARINARIPGRVRDMLSGLARKRGLDQSELAREILDEGLRRELHPGIAFRSTPTGREAAIEGHRLYVWQVMETLWVSRGNMVEAAEYLGLRPEQVHAAANYYADYRVEIDDLIRLNQEEADRLERKSIQISEAFRG